MSVYATHLSEIPFHINFDAFFSEFINVGDAIFVCVCVFYSLLSAILIILFSNNQTVIAMYPISKDAQRNRRSHFDVIGQECL